MFRIDSSAGVEECRHARSIFARGPAHNPEKRADYILGADLWEDLAEQYQRLEEIRNGRLGALRSIDQTRIRPRSIQRQRCKGVRAASREILVARREGRPSYVLTVAPMNSGIADHVEPLAIVLVVNPEWRVPSADAIVRTFGLSPAECRLAVALMQGRRMTDIARTFGVEITTIRTQLSSILKKVGVQRQSDLIRVLGDIGF